jgi:repressor LexA
MNRSQYIVYEAIKVFIEKNGFSPSLRELCEILKDESYASISYNMKKLKELGFIYFEKNKPWTTKIIKDFNCTYDKYLYEYRSLK